MSAFAIVLAVAGLAAWIYEVKSGTLRRYPYPAYVLTGTGFALGVYTYFATGMLIGIVGSGIPFVIIYGYTLGISRMGYRKRDSENEIAVGGRFPEFTLTDSDGAAFTTSQLFGNSRALYIFYRGDW